MPRHNRPQRPKGLSQDTSHRAMGTAFGMSRVEHGPDGDWMVRTVPAAQATKAYRCPGCDHEIRPGIAHVVAWPEAEQGGVADRRHWHNGCWSARGRRGPTRRWS
ncbi:hypothetical protein ACH347_43110 [Saccharopolyspora sp. 5N102]|uniref:hypothetical protein n=1 Tax=Saccharopolyspora sp. 5N102 TaxID=3375155 RepID=UPI00379A5A2A